MADEIVDVINEHNEVVGQEMKSLAHQKGLRHRVSAVLLQRKDGKYLIPTASPIKVESGGLYHSAAGHVPSGETYSDAAKRETKEELGLDIPVNEFTFLGTYWFEREYTTRKEKERFEVYLTSYEEKYGKVILKDEQTNPQWMSKEDLREILIKDPGKLSHPLKKH